MARVKIGGGGRWFDDKKATAYEEDTYWNGNNHVSVATGDQWCHEKLFRTARGAWILHSWSQWQGSEETYAVIEADDAHNWLVRNGHDDVVPAKVLAGLEV